MFNHKAKTLAEAIGIEEEIYEKECEEVIRQFMKSQTLNEFTSKVENLPHLILAATLEKIIYPLSAIPFRILFQASPLLYQTVKITTEMIPKESLNTRSQVIEFFVNLPKKTLIILIWNLLLPINEMAVLVARVGGFI